MCKELLPDISPKEMWSICSQLKKTQEIVNAFAAALNEFWWVEDNVYDYEEGTEDYKKACTITDEWKELLDYLEDKVVQRAKEEKLMKQDEKYPRAISSLSPIMEKYGYQNKQGWGGGECQAIETVSCYSSLWILERYSGIFLYFKM